MGLCCGKSLPEPKAVPQMKKEDLEALAIEIFQACFSKVDAQLLKDAEYDEYMPDNREESDETKKEKNAKRDEALKAIGTFIHECQQKVMYGLLLASGPAELEGGQEEDTIDHKALPEPQGNLKYLNVQAWSWYFLDDLKKNYTDVFESVRLNMEDSEGNKEPFTMGARTFDLGNMKVTFDGKSFQLKKSARNIRKRPDENSKGGSDGLVGSDSQDYLRLGVKF